MINPLCNGNCMQGRQCDCVPEQDEGPDLLTQIVDLLLAVVVVSMIVATALLIEESVK